MSQDDVNFPIIPTGDSQEAGDAIRLAQNLIRKMDRESMKKLEQVSADTKKSEQGVA
jgi:hypothetical protein